MSTRAKKLYRSKSEKIIFGVAGGLAEYFDADPVLVRLFFLLMTFVSGFGVFLYIFLALIMPKRGEQEDSEEKEEIKGETDAKQLPGTAWIQNRRNLLGVGVIALGVLLLMQQLYSFSIFRSEMFWPSVVILSGLYLIFKRR